LFADWLFDRSVVAKQLNQARDRGDGACLTQLAGGLSAFPGICRSEFLDVCAGLGREVVCGLLRDDTSRIQGLDSVKRKARSTENGRGNE